MYIHTLRSDIANKAVVGGSIQSFQKILHLSYCRAPSLPGWRQGGVVLKGKRSFFFFFFSKGFFFLFVCVSHIGG